MACRIGQHSTTEYVNELRKYLVNFINISESEAKYIFEMKLANLLSALVLPYNFADLHTIKLCIEHISTI